MHIWSFLFLSFVFCGLSLIFSRRLLNLDYIFNFLNLWLSYRLCLFLWSLGLWFLWFSSGNRLSEDWLRICSGSDFGDLRCFRVSLGWCHHSFGQVLNLAGGISLSICLCVFLSSLLKSSHQLRIFLGGFEDLLFIQGLGIILRQLFIFFNFCL